MRSFSCCLLALTGLFGVLLDVLLPGPVLCFVLPMGSGVLICSAVLEFSLCLVVVRVVADPFLLILIPLPVSIGLTRRRLLLVSGFPIFGSLCSSPSGHGYLLVVMLSGCSGRDVVGRMAYMAGSLGVVLFSFHLQIGLRPLVRLCCCSPL